LEDQVRQRAEKFLNRLQSSGQASIFLPPSGGNVLVDAWLATEGHIAALDGQWMAAKWKL
jgi:hypothetical protein